MRDKLQRDAVVTIGSMVLAVVLVLLCGFCGQAHATVPVRATLIDPTNAPQRIAFVRFELVRCGYNVPAVPSSPGVIVRKQVDIRPNPSTGIASGSIFGHDEISCGGSYSSLWHVTAFSDSISAIAGDRDYLICSGTTNGCPAASGTWDLATAQPFTGNLPPPGFQAIFANPISDQTVTQPTGTSFRFVGNLDLSRATVVGFAGGSGGGGSGSSIIVNGSAITGTSANFNSSIPSAPVNFQNIQVAKDALNPTNITWSIPQATNGQAGIMALSGDLAGGTFLSPQVVSTHLLAPLPISQGGTGTTTASSAFNTLAPSVSGSNFLMLSSGTNVWGTLAPPGGNSCLQFSGGVVQWLTCSSGSLTGTLTSGKIPVATGSGTIGDSDLVQVTGSSISTTDAFNVRTANVATGSSNFGSPAHTLVSSYWTGAAAANDTWQKQIVLGTGANPTSTLSFSHSGSTGGAWVGVPVLGVGNLASPFTPNFSPGLSTNSGIQAVLDSAVQCSTPSCQGMHAFLSTPTGTATGTGFGVDVLVPSSSSTNTNLLGFNVFSNYYGTGNASVRSGYFQSTAGGSGTVNLTGLEVRTVTSNATGSGGAGTNAVNDSVGIDIRTLSSLLSTTPVANDYDIRCQASMSVTAVVSHHYCLWIGNQNSAGFGGNNVDPWGVYEVSSTERNHLGYIEFGDTLTSYGSAASVDFRATHAAPFFVGTTAAISARACTWVGETAFATDATSGQNLFFCTATGTPGTWVQQLNSGTGSMSTSMNNASAVAFPVALKPSSGVLGTANADIGSGSNPIDAIWIGAAATNNAKVTGTFTAARTLTLPDVSSTLAVLGLAQTFSSAQTFTAGVLSSTVTSTSANAAASGTIRLGPSDSVRYRDTVNSLDRIAIAASGTTNGALQVGDSVGVAVSGITNITNTLPMSIRPLPGAATGQSLTLGGGPGTGAGGNGDVILDPGTGGTGAIGVVVTTGPVTVPLTNNGTTGTVINRMVSYDASGNGIVTPHGTSLGLAGVCAENCSSSGAANIVRVGTFPLNIDNTGTPGHYVCISSITDGFGTDCGIAPSTETIGVVKGLISGTLYRVDVNIGAPSSGGSASGAVLLSSSTLQTIQGTNPALSSLVVKTATGAAGSINALQVLSSAGANLAGFADNGAVQFGAGVGGSVTTSHFIGPNSSPAASGVVECSDIDICMAWRNHANNGDITLSKLTSDTVALNSVFQATQYTATAGVLTLTETSAPSGSASNDLLYGDSTRHALMYNANNAGAFQVSPIAQTNVQSGTTYTVVVGDNGKVVKFTNGSAVAVTLPQSTGVFGNNFAFYVSAIGAGTVTVTPTTSTVDGNANVAFASGTSGMIVADGAGNYTVLKGGASGGGSGDMIKNAANVMGASGTINGAAMSATAGLTLPTAAGAAPTSAGVLSYDSTLKTPVFGNGTSTFVLGTLPVNAQTGTTYTFLTTDNHKAVSFANASPIAVTLPQAGSSFPNGWFTFISNNGAGAVTITPTTSTIDGNASATLSSGQSYAIVSDGTNYKTQAKGAQSGIGDPGSNGMVVRTATNVVTARTITGTTNRLTVTNGDGVSGNPTLDVGANVVTASAAFTTGNLVSSAGNDRTTQDSGIAATSVLTTATKTDVSQAGNSCVDAGSTDAYACSLSPAITAYTTGARYRFKANTINTGAASLNLNSLGVVAIKKVDTATTNDLDDADILAGQWVEVVYDGTNFQMVSRVARRSPLAIAGGTAVLATSAISSGTCASAVTVSATGVLTTDVISWGYNADVSGVTGYDPATTGRLFVNAYPTANNVNFKVCNPTASSITPGAATLNWAVNRQPGSTSGGGGGGGGVAFVTSNLCTDTNSGTSTNSCSVTIGATTTLLVADLQWNDSSPRTVTVTTSAGVTCTWANATAKVNAAEQARQMFYCPISGTGSTTVLMTLNEGSSGYKAMNILAYSGTAASSPLDQVSTNSATSGTVCSTGSTAALAVPSELVVASCSGWDVSQTFPTVSGWTMRTGNAALQDYDQTASSAGGQSFSATISSDKWVGLIATFKPQ